MDHSAGSVKGANWQIGMGNERWQSQTNCEMANAAQTDIKYAGWTRDCWPKTELKTNFWCRSSS